MSDLMELVTKAKVRLMAHKGTAFLAGLALRMRYVEKEDIPTAATDGITMFINPEFFTGLGKEQQVTMLAHEVEHVARQHVCRVGERDKRLYNWAGDYVINLNLVKSGFAPLDKFMLKGRETSWLYDTRFEGMDTEQVYEILLKEQKDQPSCGGTGFDDLMPSSEDGDPEKAEAMAKQVEDMIVAAAQGAILQGQPGSIPGEVQVWLDSLLQPKLPMRQHLQRFFKKSTKGSFTWSKPNKRYRPQGIYMPSEVGKSLKHIAFALDMSGSVSDHEIKRYVSELAGVLKQLKPEKLTIIQFDTQIIAVDEVKNVQQLLDIDLVGRGGTDVLPVMAWAAKHKPTALIVFSDGEFHVPHQNPGVPVLWMLHTTRQSAIPFGQVVYFEA